MAHFHQGDNVKCMWLTLEAMICFFILCFFMELSIIQVKCTGALAGGGFRRVFLPELRNMGLLLTCLCCQTSVFTVCSGTVPKSAQTPPEQSGSVRMSYWTAAWHLGPFLLRLAPCLHRILTKSGHHSVCRLPAFGAWLVPDSCWSLRSVMSQ